MKKAIRILVTACGSRTVTHSLVEALRSSAHYECQVFGVDCVAQPDIHGMPFRQVPPSGDSGFLSALESACAEWRIDAIFPLIEEDLISLTNAGSSLRTLVVGPDHETACIVSDKLTLLEHLRATGVPVPGFCAIHSRDEISSSAEKLGFPQRRVVLKPRRGRGGRGIFFIDQRPIDAACTAIGCQYLPSELTPRLPGDFGNYLAMEYLDGPDYTVGCMASAGRLLFAVPVLRESLTPGITWAGAVVHNSEIVAYARKVASILHLDQYFNLQLRLLADIPLLYELNPRLSGTSGIITSAGINVVEAMLDRFLGKDLSQTEFPFRELRFRRELRTFLST